MQPVLLGALGLERNSGKYSYLRESGCTSVKTINDVEDFRYTEVHEPLPSYWSILYRSNFNLLKTCFCFYFACVGCYGRYWI